MKKFLFVLIVMLLCSVSCINGDTKKSEYVYQKTYSEVQLKDVIRDIDSLLIVYKIGYVPLDEWLTLKLNKDSGFIEQKMVSNYSDTSVRTIIYNRYVTIDSTYYEIKIRKLVNHK